MEPTRQPPLGLRGWNDRATLALLVVIARHLLATEPPPLTADRLARVVGAHDVPALVALLAESPDSQARHAAGQLLRFVRADQASVYVRVMQGIPVALADPFVRLELFPPTRPQPKRPVRLMLARCSYDCCHRASVRLLRAGRTITIHASNRPVLALFTLATRGRSITGEDTRRWFVATGQPLHEDGATHGVVVIRDVTLADRQRRLQDEFLALAAHELRTPLTSVQGYLDLLAPLLHTDGDGRTRRYATRALHQTRQLVALVRDLTDAARLHGDTLRLTLAPLNVVPLVMEVVETARAVPPAHPIRLTADRVPLCVRGDAGRLEQVLFNLFTNAATHAPSARAIDVRLRQVGSEVALEVRDYGRGIAADQLPHLFARFYQVARADRLAQGGLGLGLFLCQELVAAHGGRIAVASGVEEGTTVTVWLPLLDP